MRKIDSIPRLKNITDVSELEKGELGIDKNSNIYIRNYSGKVLIIGHENQILNTKTIYKGMSYGVVKELTGREESQSTQNMPVDNSLSALDVNMDYELSLNVTNVISFLDDIELNISDSASIELKETFHTFVLEVKKFLNYETSDTNLIKRVLQDNSDYIVIPGIDDPATTLIINYTPSAADSFKNSLVYWAFLPFGQNIYSRKYVKVIEYVDVYSETKYVTRYYFEDKYVEFIGEDTGLSKTQLLTANGEYFNSEYNYRDDAFTYLYPFNSIREVFLRDEDKVGDVASNKRRVLLRKDVMRAPLVYGEITKLQKENLFVELPVFYKKIEKNENGNRYLLISDGVYEEGFTPVESHIVNGHEVDKIYISQYMTYLTKVTNNSITTSESDSIKSEYDVKYIKNDSREVNTFLMDHNDWFNYLNTIWLIRFCGILDFSNLSRECLDLENYTFFISDGKKYVKYKGNISLKNTQFVIANKYTRGEIYYVNTDNTGKIPDVIQPFDPEGTALNIELNINSGVPVYVVPVIPDINNDTTYNNLTLSLIDDFNTVSTINDENIPYFKSFKIDGIVNPISFGYLPSYIKQGNELAQPALIYTTGYINVLTFKERYNVLNINKKDVENDLFYLDIEPQKYPNVLFSKNNSNIQRSLDANNFSDKSYSYILNTGVEETITGRLNNKTATIGQITYDISKNISNKSYVKQIWYQSDDEDERLDRIKIVQPGCIEIQRPYEEHPEQDVTITYFKNNVKWSNDYFYEKGINSIGNTISLQINSNAPSTVNYDNISYYYFVQTINNKKCLCLSLVINNIYTLNAELDGQNNVIFVDGVNGIIFNNIKLNGIYSPNDFASFVVDVAYFEIEENDDCYNKGYQGVVRTENVSIASQAVLNREYKINFNYKRSSYKPDYYYNAAYNDSRICVGCKSPITEVEFGHSADDNSSSLISNNVGLMLSDAYTSDGFYGMNDWFVTRLVIK